jgi:N,N'-diacetyllegionaminate synthase
MGIRARREKQMHKVFIIAEAGVNHNGSLKTAKMMVDAAVRAGADAIKFQTFHTQSLVSKFAVKALYQKRATGKDESQLEMLEKLELSLDAHKELMRYCRVKRILFLSAPFDLGSIDRLARLGLETFKIPSGEITNLPYLRKMGSLRRKVIMSTGMASLAEVKDALHILIKNGTKRKDIVVLQCNTEYPTPFKDVNLLAMLTMKNTLGVEVGYSDHTQGMEAALAAVALGAKVIEKHFTLNKHLSGPDHKASLEPDELRLMISAIRHVESALGLRVKRVSESERKNIPMVRKSIVALRTIKKGETFNLENITVKRPGKGISPMHWDQVIGKKAKSNFRQDELIRR